MRSDRPHPWFGGSCALLMSVAIANGQITIAQSDIKLSREFRELKGSDHLFEINRDYVIQPIGGPSEDVRAFRVRPKYFFEDVHPEWREPGMPVTMTMDAFQHLIARIQSVESLGRMVQAGTLGVTMNLRTSFWDEYQSAVVERSMFGARRVAWFTVWYLRKIQGTVDWKDSTLARSRVRVGGKLYWVSEEVFDGLRIGTQPSLIAAGPIEDIP